MKGSKRAEIQRHMGRFLLIGGCSVAVDLAFYYLLINFGHLPLPVAKGISYILGMCVGFVGNKWWTFESKRRTFDEPAIYCALYLVTLGVNIGCNSLVLVFLSPGNKPLAFIAATGVTTVLNFLGLRYLTFRQAIAENSRSQVQAVQLPAEE